MKLTRNAILALVTIGLVYFLLTTDFHKDEKAPQPSPPPPTSPAASEKLLYNPEDVSALTWSFKDKTLELKKENGHWTDSAGHSLGDDASWGAARRVSILTRSILSKDVKVPVPLGRFTVKVKGESWEGQYGDHSFDWDAGPQAGNGFDFSSDQDLKDLFGEGLFGFQSHKVKWCDSSDLRQVDFKSDWTLKKQDHKWITIQGKTTEPAREQAVGHFLQRACELTADLFIADPGQGPKDAAPILKIVEGHGQIVVQRDNGIYFSNQIPAFKSRDLDDLMTTNLDDIKDPSLEEGKVALDPSKTTPERLAAIRKIKDMRSVAGIPALKTIVFEDTNLDVYRYEAVDALAAIGTKEAFKIIADRLAQIGRSGFELRMARALSAAMGRAFKSDEKTPENIRRPEVNDLLDAYKKNPPGR